MSDAPRPAEAGGEDDTPHGVIWTLSACNFVIGMGAFVVIGLLEPVADGFGVTRGEAGALMTVYAIAYAILSPLLVSATGRIGRRRVMALGLAVFAAGSALCALAPTLWAMMAGRAVAAAGAGMFTPVSAAVAAALAAPEARGRALATVVVGLSLAQVAGVPAGGWIAYTFGWRGAFWLILALALIGVALVWTRVPQGLRLAPVTLRDLGGVLRDRLAMGAVLFTASFLAAVFVLYTYLTPLLGETMGWGRDGITLLLVIYGAGAVLGNLMGGWMADRLGAVRTLVVLTLCQIAVMPVFSGLPYPEAAVMALAFLWALVGWSFMAAQQLRLLAIAPEEASVVLALNAAAIYIGAALGSALGGAVLGAFGIGALGIAGGLAACWVLAHILWSRRAALRAGRGTAA
ncbi:MFS transporter [Roseivivax sediminis]|uniref:Predicted arabinose efflux permease, MFS family n=1 Tax=Roseivivax sediminis TaxID=936889 RepID=A0A1I1ZMK5_9RHOB|nr:MFS transporter [Roseivivax sediminis]SFE32919.1 Predicted arabinose efflux permease, MFS family [Roseivivax sediminis]